MSILRDLSMTAAPRAARIVSALILATAISAAGVRAEVPPRSEGGQMLVPPPAHLDLGDIYHITAGEDGQIVVTSDAPLQRFVAVNRRAIGYVVAPFDRKDADPPFTAGFLRIPAASFELGAPDLNDVLRSPPLLDAAAHSEITLEVLSVSDVRPIAAAPAPPQTAQTPAPGTAPTSSEVKPDPGATSRPQTARPPPPAAKPPPTYELNAACRITIKGKALERTLAIRAAMHAFTFETMNRYPGELMTIRSSFEASLADLGLERPDRSWALRIADTLKFDVFLLCNTVPPEKSLDVISTAANVQRLRYLTFARDLNQPLEADQVAVRFLRERGDDPVGLLRLAMDISREAPVGNRNLPLAQAAARRASELTKDADMTTLHTLAGVCAERGDFAAAVEWEKKAVDAAGQSPPPVLDELKRTLERYQAMAGAAAAGSGAGAAATSR